MWLPLPDKPGCWLVNTECGKEMFVNVTESDGLLIATVPLFSVLDGIGRKSKINVMIFVSNSDSKFVKGWSWREIVVPDVCPNFDVEMD
jgi:hypothetical protein